MTTSTQQQGSTSPTTREVPDRTPIQRMEALSKANEVRGKRAQLKLDLKYKRVKALDIFLEPPEWVKTMKVYDVIISCPGYGKVKTNKLLEACRISTSKTIGGMSPRQRMELGVRMRR